MPATSLCIMLSRIVTAAFLLVGAPAQDAPSNALEALTQPYTVYSEITTSDKTATSTIATAVTTILQPVDTSGQTTWSSSSSSSSTTSPSPTTSSTNLSTTTAIATFTNPHSAAATLTASAALPTNPDHPDPFVHNTLLVYDTPVIAGYPATSINGATYSLAPSGVALYVDGQSEKVPWATTRVVYSSGGGGGFVTAIASEEAGTSVVSSSVSGGGAMSVLVGTASGGSKTSMVVASATNGAGRPRAEVVGVVVVGVLGAGVVGL